MERHLYKQRSVARSAGLFLLFFLCLFSCASLQLPAGPPDKLQPGWLDAAWGLQVRQSHSAAHCPIQKGPDACAQRARRCRLVR